MILSRSPPTLFIGVNFRIIPSERRKTG